MGAREDSDVGDGKREWQLVTFTEELDRRLFWGAAIMDPDSEEILIRHERSWRSAEPAGQTVWVRPSRQLQGRVFWLLREGDDG